MQICLRCGTQNEASAAFCSNRDCGVVLEWHGQRVDDPGARAVGQQGLAAVRPDRPAEGRQRPRNVAVAASLSSDTVEVEPGQTAGCELRVHNRGTIVDQFGVEVGGPAAGWASCEPSNINLYPDSDGTVAVQFAPPRGPQPAAGTVPFQVRVTSSQDPSVSVVEGGMVTVAPFEELSGELVPETGDGRMSASYQLTTENRGNSQASLAIDAQDPDQRLACAVVPPSLRSAPGTTELTAIDVQAKQRHWIGSPQRHPFTVTATRPDDPARVPVFQKQGAFRQKAMFPYWLLALLVILLVLIVLAFLLFRTDTVEVPDVVDLTAEEAETRLQNAGLDVATETEPSEEPEGTVLGQDPPAETTAEAGDEVTITVAEPVDIDVPDLSGQSQEAAETILDTAGLTIGEVLVEEVEPTDERDGTVIDQSPAAESVAPAGSPVDITVATSDIREVPDLSGQSEATAQATLTNAGLRLGTVTRTESDEPEGTVTDQNPPPETELPADSTVEITIAVPMEDEEDGDGDGDAVPVPDVRGLRLDDARDELEGADLEVGQIAQEEVEEVDADGPSGVVLDQDPAADDELEQGEAVDLVYRAVVVHSDAETHRAFNEFDGTHGLDPDDGTYSGSGATEGDDVLWTTMGGPSLSPIGDAQFANLGTLGSEQFDDIRLDQLEDADFSDDEITAAAGGAGTVVAVRTDEGNVAKLILVEPLDDIVLDIEYVTYAPSG